MVEMDIIINIENGLHARPSADLVGKLNQFDSSVLFYEGTREFNAKSIISMMSASFKQGQEIRIVVDGKDEESTVRWLKSFLSGEKQ